MSGTGTTELLDRLTDWLPLALAGGAGAACRWLVDTYVNRASTAVSAFVVGRRGSGGPQAPRMPWGTIVVNVTACLLMGLLVGRAGGTPKPGAWEAAALSVLGTGFLGG